MDKKKLKTKKKDYVPTVLHKPSDMSAEEWRELNGIPNWTISSDYPKNLSRDQIKWEFLRRNYYYKLRYEEFYDEDGMRIVDFDDEDAMMWLESSAGEYELVEFINPNVQANKLKKSIFIREIRGTRVFGHDEDGQYFKLGLRHHRTFSLLEDDRFAVFAFDLRYPLIFQIQKQAYPKLKKLQNELKKNDGANVLSHDGKTKDYVKHLRVLDAYSERQSSLNIGKTIFGIKDDKDARDRAAKEFKRALSMWKYF